MRAKMAIVVASMWFGLSVARPAAAFVVDSNGDAADACPCDGVCATGGTCISPTGPCTLRAAIQEANCAGGGTITFAIGTGQQTIQLTAGLSLNAPGIVIDGTTQPGPPGDPCEYPGTPLIELDGSLTPAGTAGLILFGGTATVRGLVINRFRVDSNCVGGAGISVQSDSNIIQCNFIGPDVTGTLPGPGNEGVGISISNADDNLIGGTTPGDRNVISHNGHQPTGCGGGQGISIDGNNPSVFLGNTIQNNYIGTDVTGSAPLGNKINGVIIHASWRNRLLKNVISDQFLDNGVDIVGTGSPFTATQNVIRENFIGTNAAGTAAIPNRQGVRLINNADGNFLGLNLISGNTQQGVFIHGSAANSLTENLIGTNAGGVVALPNGTHGVHMFQSHSNVVGGTLATTPGDCTGPCNVIAYNDGVGVFVQGLASVGNDIRRNSIFRNGPGFSGLGIDLAPSIGVDPNDTGDPDAGANNLQNSPVLATAFSTYGGIVVSGTLDSTPSSNFDIDIFANDACDPSNHGEGGTWLGTVNVSTPASGVTPFSIIVPTSVVFPGGHVLTATASDTTTDDTSEFSNCISVPLDHFSCHKVFRYKAPSFPGFTGLPLTDRFTSRTANARAVRGLCAPTDKNGEDATAPSHFTHLENYKLLGGGYSPTAQRFDLILKDQFGILLSTIDARKAESLMVPTAKRTVAVYPLAPTPGVVDDFLCYRMRQFGGGNFPGISAPLTTNDQFGPDAFTSLRPWWLCTPVDVSSSNPPAPTHPDQLTCYKLPMAQATNWNANVWVGNRFGPEALRVLKQNVLCVPSRIGCVGACLGGTAPGQPCAEDANCPGAGATCDIPACCCAPDGATACELDADCPGSRCECS
jgi:parallel beta-helix repeat protein